MIITLGEVVSLISPTNHKSFMLVLLDIISSSVGESWCILIPSHVDNYSPGWWSSEVVPSDPQTPGGDDSWLLTRISGTLFHDTSSSFWQSDLFALLLTFLDWFEQEQKNVQCAAIWFFMYGWVCIGSSLAAFGIRNLVWFGFRWGTGPSLCKQWRWVFLDKHQIKVLLQDIAMERNQPDLEPLQSKKTCHWNNHFLLERQERKQEENKFNVNLNLEVSLM